MDSFVALADPTRRQLLCRLAGGPARVVDLAADHPVSRPAISRHLRLLTDAGLVVAEVHGRERHYRLVPGPLEEVRGLVDVLSPRRPPVPAAAFDALETEVRRTARERRLGPAAPAPAPVPDLTDDHDDHEHEVHSA